MDSGRKSEAQRFLKELQEKAFFKERKKIEVRNAEKTARLKVLRLAKEAQDAEAIAGQIEVKRPRVKKSRTPRLEDNAALGDAAAVVQALPRGEDAT